MSGAGGSSQSVQGVQSNMDVASRQGNRVAQMGMALQLKKLASEVEVNKSVAEANRADAVLKGAGTETENQKRAGLIALLNEQGWSQYLQNLVLDWKISGETNESLSRVFSASGMGGSREIYLKGPEAQQITDVIKTIAEAGNIEAQKLLNNEKAMAVMKELIIAQQNADANSENAAVNKLKAEFETGSDINWKNIGEVLIKLLSVLRK